MAGYVPYGEPGWMRVLRWLAASFRIARVGPTEIRMYWLGAILVPLITLEWYARFMPLGQAAVLAGMFTVGLFALITVHEFGHALGGRRYGIPTPLVTLSPMGGLAHMAASAPHARAEIVVALAGPATHLLWFAVLWPLTGLVETRPWDDGLRQAIQMLWRTNLGLFCFNLLPCFPMDFGRALRGVLALRMHPNRATSIAVRVGYVGAVGIFIWGIVIGSFWGGILFAIAISNFLACRREMMAARHLPSPYGGGEILAPWQEDSEAWKRAATESQRQPGFFARRKARRAREREMKEVADQVALEKEVDRILARVSEVGMAGLTKTERETLLRASKAKRRE
jgi:Zn-dependent protease